ncbi:MAG TPA: hypothetical protein VLL25_15030 [Acidimicrobiales bacterium]|nr:hypothetical protein [Acidimicrobiales bacterium]
MTYGPSNLETDLTDLADLAGSPGDPHRLSHLLSEVYRRDRRFRRRRVAAGVGVVAASLAAAPVLVETLGGPGGSRGTVVASSGPATGPTLSCHSTQPGESAGLPAVGQQFQSGGKVVGTPGATATSLRIAIDGGALSGRAQVFAIASTTRFLAATGGTPAQGYTKDESSTLAALQDGMTVKFMATRTDSSSYRMDEVHFASNYGGPSQSTPTKVAPTDAAKAVVAKEQGRANQTPTAVGDAVKGEGVVGANPTSSSITIDITAGPMTGQAVPLVVTSKTTLSDLGQPCTGAALRAGDRVTFVASRTGQSTYTALSVARQP